MLILGPLGFVTPWLLVALAALPVLWIILRAVPPSPRTVDFPGTRLLLGLADPNPVAQRTPWWLLLLRLLAIAALIVGFSGPVWKPSAGQGSDLPLLVVVDGGWSNAAGWPALQARAIREIEAAGSAGQPVALLIADGRDQGAPVFGQGSDLAARMRALQPVAWRSRYPADPQTALADAPAGGMRTLWLSDGLDHPGRAEWLAAVSDMGPVTVVTPQTAVQALEMLGGEKPRLIWRASADLPAPVIRAVGPDPQGVLRELARLTPAEASDEDGITTRPVPIDLPSELRNRITRFEIEGQPSAGAVVLADDRIRRRKVALVGDDRATEGQELLSPMHYLRQAIAATNDVVSGNLGDVLQAAPDVIVIVDQTDLPDTPALAEWVAEGGMLIRFAGPRMAAAQGLLAEPLLPLRLREGGRDVGGALSWGEPRGIAPFDAAGPFAGLTIPEDVAIRAQLLPEPGPEVDQQVIARLSDQTPLVSRAALDRGQLVLFHTTANAEWTNLPLSGLFVQMLERLIQSARMQDTAATATPDAEISFWTAETVLDGFGRAVDASDLAPVRAEDFAQGPGPLAPAGVYTSGERRSALNAGGAMQLATWPGATVETAGAQPGVPLLRWLIALAAVLFALDALGSALLSRGRRGANPASTGTATGGTS